jgi:DNA-binding CsgD family transcriptional regulator
MKEDVSVPKLSEREKQLLLMIAGGLKTSEIAVKMHISEGTVDKHRKNITKKLNVNNTAQAVAHAIRNKIIE